MAMFIDTETSGLPDTHNLRWGVYPDYWKLNKYENARIVQFSMLITDTQFKYEDVKDYIIKREGFEITNGEFHGITNEISDNIGVDFNVVAIDIFYELLKNITHIVAHNVAFDVGVIKSELHRRNLGYIIEELDKKTLLCTMKHMKPILKIINPYGNYKNPSLNEIYKFINPHRIAGETRKENFVHNMILGGMKRASRYEGGTKKELKSYSPSFIRNLEKQHKSFKRGNNKGMML